VPVAVTDGQDPGELIASAVRDCVALDRAARIAEWVGGGKPLTPKGVLRPGDVRQAAGVVGVTVPAKFRSAADVLAWHLPWSVAVAAGMVTVESDQVVAEPPVDVTPELWLVGLAAALSAAFDDENGAGALAVGRVALTELETRKARTATDLYRTVWHEIADDYDLDYWRLREAGGYEQSGATLITIFTEFGMITEQARLTELGRWALSELIARGDGVAAGPPAVAAGMICQLKITLTGVSPACWRRVLVSADTTLYGLHWVIQAAMRWDDDHLHAFTVGRSRYGDPGHGMSDEDGLTVGGAFTRSRKTIGYTYDFGDDWRHDITLEKTHDVQPDTAYPVCVAGSGAVPVEDSMNRMIKFDQDDINRRLGALPAREEHAVFDKTIEMIIVDAYDDDEQLSAFVTVLEDELQLPAVATLLGSPVTVLGLDFLELPRGPFVRCRGAHGEGEIALADVCFPPGTVTAWIHAAYRHYLGLEPFPATPRPNWRWPVE
jgi:pRiA4b ORF-3-like protein